MNKIRVWEPRWSTRDVLIADYKIEAHNEINIDWHEFPDPIYLSGERARTFPLEDMKTKNGSTIKMRAIPIDEIKKEVI